MCFCATDTAKTLNEKKKSSTFLAKSNSERAALPSRIMHVPLFANRGRRAPAAVTSPGCGLPSARVSPGAQQSCWRRRGADASLCTGPLWRTFSRLTCNARTSKSPSTLTRALCLFLFCLFWRWLNNVKLLAGLGSPLPSDGSVWSWCW